MTEMDPLAIHTFGRNLREQVTHRAGGVAVRFSPGNLTCYELTIVGFDLVSGEAMTEGEFPALRSIESRIGGRPVLISKTNGTTWAWWLSMDQGYLDPVYVKQNTGMGWPDVAPVGLMLNGFRGLSIEDVRQSPYMDGAQLDLSLGGAAPR